MPHPGNEGMDYSSCRAVALSVLPELANGSLHRRSKASSMALAQGILARKGPRSVSNLGNHAGILDFGHHSHQKVLLHSVQCEIL